MSLIFTVGRTYDEVTPESAENGDTDDAGWVFEPMEMDFKALMRELTGEASPSFTAMTQLSCGPPLCDNGHCWASSEYWTSDYVEGRERQESVHISKVNGKPITGHQLKRLYKAAGIKVR